MARAKPADVRAAREFLRHRGLKGISPRKFADSSVETGMDYRSLLEFLAGVTRSQDGNSEEQAAATG